MGQIRTCTDESVSAVIAEGLKRRNVDAFTARDADNLSLTDEDQRIYAGKEKATIFTHDTGFIQIAAKWVEEGGTHHGPIAMPEQGKKFNCMPVHQSPRTLIP